MLGLLADDLLIQLFSAAREDLFDVLASLGRCLEALVDVVGSSEFNSAVKVDLTGRLKLALVSDEVNADIFCSMLLNLFKPAL